MKTQVTIGSDPELMLQDNSGKIVSAITVLDNSKKTPIDLGDDIKLYADNVLAEVAFPPSETKYGIIDRFRDVLGRVQNYLGDRYRLVAQASHDYDMDELSCNRAWEAGCDPTFDAYNLCQNKLFGFNSKIRTGSAHIHIGNEKIQNEVTRIKMIKLMDIYVGCSSVIFDKDETSKERRKIYGRASEYRPTDYGLEYRCLGPYVLRSPDLMTLAVDLSLHALEKIENNEEDDILSRVDSKDIIYSINQCDRNLARVVLNKVGISDSFKRRIEANYDDDMYKCWKI